MCHYISLKEEQAGRQRGLGADLKDIVRSKNTPAAFSKGNTKYSSKGDVFGGRLKPGCLLMPGNQLLQMGLFANKMTTFSYLHYLGGGKKKEAPSCYTDPAGLLGMHASSQLEVRA